MKKYVFIQPYNGINCATVFNLDKTVVDTYFSHGLPSDFEKQWSSSEYIIVTEDEAIALNLDIYED